MNKDLRLLSDLTAPESEPAAPVSLRRRGAITIAVVLLIMAFYILSGPANRTESDDGFELAYRIENRPITELITDSRLALYVASMRGLFEVSKAVGLKLRAHDLLRSVSIFAAALSLILIYNFSKSVLRLSSASSGVGTCTLAVCYGFWRYANEVEVYPLATFFVLLVILIIARAEKYQGDIKGSSSLIVASLLAGSTVLTYQPTVIPLFFALPVVFLRKNFFSSLFVYLLIGGGVIGAGYIVFFRLAYSIPLTIESFFGYLIVRNSELEAVHPSLSVMLLGLLNVGHNVISSNWLFAFDPFVETVKSLFAGKNILEEGYAAQKAGYLVFLPFVLLPIMLGLFVKLIITALKKFQGKKVGRWELFLVVWAVTYFLIVVILAHDETEVPIMLLPALILLFTRFVIEPCILAGRRTLVLTAVAMLFVYNAAGGIGVVYSRDGDYWREKGRWVLGNAGMHDVIIVTPESGAFGRFVRYVGRGQVHYTGKGTLQDASQTAVKNGGRIFLFDDFLKILESPKEAKEQALVEAKNLLEFCGGRVELVSRSKVGATYEMFCPLIYPESSVLD